MTMRHGVRVALVSAICLYGALLRFEAFHSAYGPLAGSRPFIAAQVGIAEVASRLRPASLEWARAERPYRFDAKSYLDSARAMRHFYEARLREPLFVFSTKVGLWLTGGQDIAVSLVSSTFGALVVLATYALGRALGGALVGLGAAGLMAIEPQMIGSGVAGYRDDLFTLLTVLFAWACIRLIRSLSVRTALLVGLVGAAAGLTRITGLTFVIPGLAAVVAVRGGGRRREASTRVLIAGVVVAALVAPFLYNCWVEFGDPLYSINWHSAFYSRRGQIETKGDVDTAGLLLAQIGRSPLVTADSVLRGLTHYPWANKWTELGRHWGAPLASASKYLALVGLLMWLWSAPGRIALVVLATATLPFAFTWEAFADWRFTEHAYPFYMVAAVLALVEPLRWVVSLARNGQPARQRAGQTLRRVLASLSVAAGYFAAAALLPPLIVYQQLASGQASSVGGDARMVFFMPRDVFFFGGGGWSPHQAEGNVTFRDPEANRGRLRVPMSGEHGYRCLVRLAPPERDGEPRVVDLTVNEWSGRMSLEEVPDGIPRYWATIPAGAARTGLNRVEIVTDGRSTPAFRFWFVRFFPQP